jgi:hypothetical protein
MIFNGFSLIQFCGEFLVPTGPIGPVRLLGSGFLCSQICSRRRREAACRSFRDGPREHERGDKIPVKCNPAKEDELVYISF